MFGWDYLDFDFDSAARVMPQPGLGDVTFGLVAGTRVATQLGWRPVEAVAVGDEVLTFDGGLQVVTGISREVIRAEPEGAPEDSWPLRVPAGALGNREETTLLPGQTVLIESDAAEEVFGDPFALIPAAALEGFRGITRYYPNKRLEVVTLRFARDEIVFANVGALFHCPRCGDLVAEAMGDGSPYEVLGFEAAETLVTLLEIEDGTAVAPAAPAAGAVHVAA